MDFLFPKERTFTPPKRSQFVQQTQIERRREKERPHSCLRSPLGAAVV